MMMHKTELAIIGAGPAGLCAALEAAKYGVSVTLIDENSKPGGQLFKQIHKFFGSREHNAGIRGYRIGENLLKDIQNYNNINIWLDSVVYGLVDDHYLDVVKQGRIEVVEAQRIIIATGASEKPICFPGWTLPGVMGAGAIQTMININRVLPGRKLLIVGSGNVGLIVAYQFLQAGGQVVAVIEAMPRIGGYGVHAAKIRRLGVPILTSTTIKAAYGENKVKKACLININEKFEEIQGTEKTIEVDLIGLAVGLYPLVEVPYMAGCKTIYNGVLGGRLPLHDNRMETTKKGIYVAGDVAGIEEASTAMEEGRLAGISVAEDLGKIDFNTAESERKKIRERLDSLRLGPFGRARNEAKQNIESFFEVRCK